MIKVKRVYESSAPDDGARFLVDRLWPRGMSKKALKLDDWLKEVAPSSTLRRWFGHDSARWAEFQSRYFEELEGKPETWGHILEAIQRGNVTLLYSTHDRKRNNAVALKAYLRTKRRSI